VDSGNIVNKEGKKIPRQLGRCDIPVMREETASDMPGPQTKLRKDRRWTARLEDRVVPGNGRSTLLNPEKKGNQTRKPCVSTRENHVPSARGAPDSRDLNMSTADVLTDRRATTKGGAR